MVAPVMVASVSAPVLPVSSGSRGGPNAVSSASAAEIDTFDEDPRETGMKAPGLQVTCTNTVGDRDSQDRAQEVDLRGDGESSPPGVPLSEAGYLPRESGTSSGSVPRGKDFLGSETACLKRDSLIRSGSGRGEGLLTTSRSSNNIVAEPRVPAHPPPSRLTKLETPSFVSAKVVASAAACLESLSVSEEGNFTEKSPVSMIPEQLWQPPSQSPGEEDGGHDDPDDDAEGGVAPSPWLEEEEDEGGLGLGLRLGAEAMNSPPPRLDSKSSTGLWSPRCVVP